MPNEPKTLKSYAMRVYFGSHKNSDKVKIRFFSNMLYNKCIIDCTKRIGFHNRITLVSRKAVVIFGVKTETFVKVGFTG